MMTMVCFQCGGASYCLPVGATLAVRTAAGLLALPGARRDVAGILPGRPALTVLSVFGDAGAHILVVEAGDVTFGLLVDAVTGLRRIPAADIRSAPPGQDRGLISGTVETDGALLLVADSEALAARL